MSFQSLGLSKPLLRAVEQLGFSTPTPIQQQAIPAVLNKRDLLASAQTGTGKTAAFSMPMLQLLDQSRISEKRVIRALILTPTRELAAQVQADIRDYGRYMSLRSTVIYGGVNANPQKDKLRKGVDIVIATPGRLLDLHQQKALRLDKVEFLVLDEADRMLDMGFQRDLNRILDLLPKQRQNLLFSATFSKAIKALAGEFLHQPQRVEATPENSTVDMIQQKVYHVDKSDKPAVLTQLIKTGNWQQVLVFTRTKHGANKLATKLERKGITATAIHGNKSQGARTKALADFKANRVSVLVATDIAARGLDIPQLPHVVNFELPNVPEDYVHRIGRTGRAGAAGEAISLVMADEKPHLRGIEKLIGQRIDTAEIEGFSATITEPAPVAKPKAKSTKPRHKRRRRYSRQA